MSAKFVAIVNPKSGGGKSRQELVDMRDRISSALGSCEWLETDGPAHATTLAREASNNGASLIIAIGGDGTIHEVAAGILKAETKSELGIIGRGTGGDYRRSLDLPNHVDAYIHTIVRGNTRNVDAGRATFRTHSGEERETYFLNILSCGISGLVDAYVASTTKAFGGRAAYFMASLRGFLDMKAGNVTCTLDTPQGPVVETFSSFLLGVCLGKYFGAGQMFAPMAVVDDGYFDFVALRGSEKMLFARVSAGITKGDHIKDPSVFHAKCTRIRIVPDGEQSFLPLDVDGEPIGTLPLDVELLPGALRIRC